jgi:hypothetical protein
MTDFNQKRSIEHGDPPEIIVQGAGPKLKDEIGREVVKFLMHFDRFPESNFERNLVVKQAKLNLEWRKVKRS